MTDDEAIAGMSRIAAKFIIDCLDIRQEYMAVAVLQEVTIAVLAKVLVSLHDKGDRLGSREAVEEGCVLLLSSMAPAIIKDVEHQVSEAIGITQEYRQ